MFEVPEMFAVNNFAAPVCRDAVDGLIAIVTVWVAGFDPPALVEPWQLVRITMARRAHTNPIKARGLV
jgi:hypothetical protein